MAVAFRKANAKEPSTVTRKPEAPAVHANSRAKLSRALVIGATSAIAEATTRLFAARGYALHLVARNSQQLEAIAADLRIRGASHVSCDTLDANDFSSHERMLEQAQHSLGIIEIVLIAHGTLSDQSACQHSVDLTLQELTTNALSTVAIVTRVATLFEHRSSGTLVVISSVAGDRGRASNYVYGSAKALVTTYLSGVRQRLSRHGVSVITIKPGFVDTPMTAAFPKGALWAEPALIAKGILKSIDQKRDVVYLPSYWRLIMLVVKAIPENVFKKLNF
jgi:short-subunit dehydrogenase